MTTFTVKQAEELAKLDLRKKRAWSNYTKSLQDLAGRDYEEAEGHSWNRLQKKLKEIEGQRDRLEQGSAAEGNGRQED